MNNMMKGLTVSAFMMASNAANAEAYVDIVADIHVKGGVVSATLPTERVIAGYYAGGARVRTDSSGGTGCPSISVGTDAKPDLTQRSVPLSKNVGVKKAAAIDAAGCVLILP